MSARPGELVVELVQMTPMIHFQATEKGATLRATEVKPKLDRYLIHAAFHDNSADYGKYLVGRASGNEEITALDYRLVIIADPADVAFCSFSDETVNNRGSVEYKNHIGSIWERDKPTYGTLVNQYKTIKLVFRSRHQALINLISQWIDAFFASENFGRRQSKGYGSFLTVESAKSFSAYEIALNKHMLQTEWPKEGLKVHYFEAAYSDWKNALNDIRDMHRALKSGENARQFGYSPSYLMKVFAAAPDNALQRFDNEKKLIKVDLLQKCHPDVVLSSRNRSGGVYDQRYVNSHKEGRFMRAMLGLPGFYEFRTVLINGNPYTIRINIDHNSIKRFRAPITYKPIRIRQGSGWVWRCFLIPVPLPKEMHDVPFFFSVQKATGETYKDPANPQIKLRSPQINVERKNTTIATPSADEFDLLKLLEGFCSATRTINLRYRTERSFKHIEIEEEAAQHE